MSVKIKHGATPEGTLHEVPTYVGKELKTPLYKVASVWGRKDHLPSNPDPIIFLAYAGGPVDYAPTPFLSFPLSMFVNATSPATVDDIFYQFNKQQGE